MRLNSRPELVTSNSKDSDSSCSSCLARLSGLSLAILLVNIQPTLAADMASSTAKSTAQPSQPNALDKILLANTATAKFNRNNEDLSASSNTVTIELEKPTPRYAIDLTRPPIKTINGNGQSQRIEWNNTLTNNSNSIASIILNHTQPDTLSDFKIYQDINKNGVLDDNDVLVPDMITLKRGESIDLIVQANTSPTFEDGDSAQVTIDAVVLEDKSVSASANDELVVIAPKIQFTDSKFDTPETTNQVGDNVYVETKFAQCNQQADQRDQVWVTISSSLTGDKLSLKGIETGNNTGKFHLTAPTQNNANAVDDDIIQTLDNDKLTALLEACIAPSVDLDQTPSSSELGAIDGELFTNIDIVDSAPSLQVTKVGDVKSAELGDYVNYTINVKNNGEATAYNVELKDTLPQGFDITKNSVRISTGKDSAGKNSAANQINATNFLAQGKYQVLGLGSLAGGETKTITYQVLVGASALRGDGINRAFASAKDTNNNDFRSLEAQWQVKVNRGVMNSDGIIIGKVYNDINRDGIQQKQMGELGVAGVRLYMEDGNFAVTDAEGKYNFYGVSAKTHVVKVDRTTLPANVELVEQGNRNTGDPSSRFVDLKYGELHRADFAITDGLADSSTQLNTELIARRDKVQSDLNALEQAVKANLSIHDVVSSSADSDKAEGCKLNGASDTSKDCEQAIVYRSDNSNSASLITATAITAPEMVDLESYIQSSTDNSSRFINLTPNQILPIRQVNAQLLSNLNHDIKLFVNGDLVPESRIGKTGRLESQQIIGFDYFGIPLKVGKNTLTIKAYDQDHKVVDTQSISLIAPGDITAIKSQLDKSLVEANGSNKIQALITLQDSNGTPVASDALITVDTNIGTILNKDLDPNLPGTQIMVSGSQSVVDIQSPKVPGKGTLQISANGIESRREIQFVPNLRPLIAVGIVEGAISLKDFDPDHISNAQGAFEKELHEFAGNDDYSATGRAAMFLKGKVRGDYLLTLSYDSDKKGERLFRDIQPDEYYPVYGDASAKGFDAQSSSKLYVRLDKGRSFAMFGDIKTQITDDEGIKLGSYNRTLTGLKARYEDDNTRVTSFAAETSTSQQVNETRGLGVSGPYPINTNFNAVLENSESVEVIVRNADNPGVVISRTALTRFADYEIDPVSHSLYLKTPIPSQDLDGNPVYLRVTVEVDKGGDKYWVGGISAKRQLTNKIAIGGSYINSDNPLNKEELASINTVVQLNKRTKLVAEYAKNEAQNPNYQSANQINSTNLDQLDAKGDALRVELSYKDDRRTSAKAYYNTADKGFVTGSSPLTAGRSESGVDVDYRLGTDNKTKLKVAGVQTKDNVTKASQQGIKAGIEHQLTDNITGELGVRYYKQDAAAASRNIQEATSTTRITDDTIFNNRITNQSAIPSLSNASSDIEGTTVRAKVSARLPKLNTSLLNSTQVFAEYEQDIEHSNRNATAIGGETALGSLGRLYARHDLINSLTGSYGLDDSNERQRTVIGFDANYMKDGKVYSEYRMRDSLSAREAEAAIGLNNKWYIRDGLTVNTLFERIESLSGNSDQTSTAASIGAEYLAHDDYKLSGRFEKRWGGTSDTLLATAGAAYRYNDDITLLAKDIYSNVTYADGHRMVNRFQVGAAYRDYDSNQLDMLSKLEYRIDDNLTGEAPYQKDALVWSLHGNYHPTRPLTLSGHYAGKYTQYNASGLDSDNTAHAAYIRGLYDINERWDAGLQAGSYWNDEAHDTVYMLGAEVGYSPMSNLWLSLGYNFMGFSDEDIASDDSTQQGAYFKMRFKFDEDLFKRQDPSKNKSIAVNKFEPKEPAQSQVNN